MIKLVKIFKGKWWVNKSFHYLILHFFTFATTWWCDIHGGNCLIAVCANGNRNIASWFTFVQWYFRKKFDLFTDCNIWTLSSLYSPSENINIIFFLSFLKYKIWTKLIVWKKFYSLLGKYTSNRVNSILEG